MRAVRRAASTTLAIAACAALAGCGGDGRGGDGRGADERAVAEAVRGYLAAVAERDGARACAHLTRNAQLGVFEFRRVHAAPDHPDEACAEVVRETAARLDEARLRDAAVEEVAVDGDRATARVAGAEALLRRVGGRWLIDAFGLAGDVGGGGAAPLRLD